LQVKQKGLTKSSIEVKDREIMRLENENMSLREAKVGLLNENQRLKDQLERLMKDVRGLESQHQSFRM
jgi:predicted nuclease with TOPRIM domain